MYLPTAAWRCHPDYGVYTMEKSVNFLDGTIVILLGLIGFAIIASVPNLI